MLIILICEELKINLSNEFHKKLKAKSRNSPRFVKKFFRNTLACCISDEIDYESILSETERELKQYYNG